MLVVLQGPGKPTTAVNLARFIKNTLGQDMKRDAIVLVRSIYRANKAKNKTEYLETFLDEFEIIKC